MPQKWSSRMSSIVLVRSLPLLTPRTHSTEPSLLNPLDPTESWVRQGTESPLYVFSPGRGLFPGRRWIAEEAHNASPLV